MQRTTPLAILLALGASAAAGAALLPGCGHYDPPPSVAIEGLQNGVLDDSRAPLVVDFGMPIDTASLRLTLAFVDTDLEGNLPDEDDDPTTELRVILRLDRDLGDVDVVASFTDGDSKVSLAPSAALPVGPKLVVLVEPGLRSKDGRERSVRARVPLSYTVKCAAHGQATAFKGGTYFALLEVEKPLGTQIQLFGAIDVDPATGALIGQFTNADRNPDTSRCPTPCASTDACRLLPTAACVAPSTPAATVDEYSDFVPNAQAPTGYSFEVRGCAVDDGDAADVLTAPATMVVTRPNVTVQGLTMTAQFTVGADQIARGSGSLTADATLLGTTALGPGKGTMRALRIPDDRVPAGVLRPRPAVADAGTQPGNAAEGGP